MEERHCFPGAVNFLPRELPLPLTLPPLALGALPRKEPRKEENSEEGVGVVKRLLAPVEGVREKERVLGVEVPNLIERSVESCTSFTILSSNILEESRVEDLREFTEALDTLLFTLSNTESRLNNSILARILVCAVTERPKSFFASRINTSVVSNKSVKRSGKLEKSSIENISLSINSLVAVNSNALLVNATEVLISLEKSVIDLKSIFGLNLDCDETIPSTEACSF